MALWLALLFQTQEQILVILLTSSGDLLQWCSHSLLPAEHILYRLSQQKPKCQCEQQLGIKGKRVKQYVHFHHSVLCNITRIMTDHVVYVWLDCVKALQVSTCFPIYISQNLQGLLLPSVSQWIKPNRNLNFIQKMEMVFPNSVPGGTPTIHFLPFLTDPFQVLKSPLTSL